MSIEMIYNPPKWFSQIEIPTALLYYVPTATETKK